MSELIPYGGLGCQGSAPMPFVKQRRRGWVGRLAVSEDGPEGDVAAGQANAGAGAPRYLSPACGLRLASFHHAAMVLPAQTPRQGRLPASLRDGLRPALTRTLVQQTGSAMRKGRGALPHAGRLTSHHPTGDPAPAPSS